ncbi:MAG: hypothetical protein ABSF98_06035 [Bryobacteraceae bacterium]|jgi:hypothetical protein
MAPRMNRDQLRWAQRIGWLLVTVLACSLQAGEPALSPHDFVQEFYNWYAPKTLQNNPVRTWDIAVKDKSAMFSPELLRALKEDSLASDKSAGDIVGLDFDPFLYSQDPAPHYELGRITARGAGWLVEVHAAQSGRKSQKPNVVAELSAANGRWQFVNFHYEGGQDLTSILKTLRQDREKDAK